MPMNDFLVAMPKIDDSDSSGESILMSMLKGLATGAKSHPVEAQRLGQVEQSVIGLPAFSLWQAGSVPTSAGQGHDTKLSLHERLQALFGDTSSNPPAELVISGNVANTGPIPQKNLASIETQPEAAQLLQLLKELYP